MNTNDIMTLRLRKEEKKIEYNNTMNTRIYQHYISTQLFTLRWHQVPAETVKVKLSSAFPGMLPSVKGIFFTRIPFSMKAWQRFQGPIQLHGLQMSFHGDCQQSLHLSCPVVHAFVGGRCLFLSTSIRYGVQSCAVPDKQLSHSATCFQTHYSPPSTSKVRHIQQ